MTQKINLLVCVYVLSSAPVKKYLDTFVLGSSLLIYLAKVLDQYNIVLRDTDTIHIQTDHLLFLHSDDIIRSLEQNG